MNIKTNRFMLIIAITAMCSTQAMSETLPPVINEVQSSNVTTIADRDGEYSDWIELFNPGTTTVDLTGYGLSDNKDEPYRWVFPNWNLSPGRTMLVFASGKDIKENVTYWETVIDQGDTWRYLIPLSEPPSDWNTTGFDDSGWDSGPSGFGNEDGDDATELPPVLSLYLRKTFTVEDTSLILSCYLHVDFDDGFVAYLNGQEIARANMVGRPPSFSRAAVLDREAQMYSGGAPQKLTVPQIRSYLIEGKNVLAIQVHNRSTTSDMTIIPFLTFGLSRPPTNSRGVSAKLRDEFDVQYFHTNFKISSGGETLTLTDSSGILCDEVDIGEVPADFSYGRQPDGGPEWVVFSSPTPGERNNIGTTSTEPAESPTASPPGGLYHEPIPLSLSVPSPSAMIRYTLDGSVPTESSEPYISPLFVTESTVVRARAYDEGFLPGDVTTHTYVISDRAMTLPVVSLSSDPANFFDPQVGIYHNNNIKQDWERPVHVELFEPDGSLGFSTDGGMKLFGKSTRGLPQKSFTIFARQKYGTDAIEYPIFPDLPITSFTSFVLRNGGSDNTINEGGVHFRDGLVSMVVNTLDLDKQAYRPAIVFINGQYWGIYNIREKLNEDFLAAHHGVDPDSVDILDDYHTLYPIVVEGDADHFNALIDYLKEHDLGVQEYADYVATQINVPNYIDYMASQIWYVNHDGPGHNSKFWRPRTPDGKYRWLLFDTDHAFGMRVFIPNYHYEPEAYKDNTIAYYRKPNGPSWPNPPESTFLFRKILENEGFKHLFITRLSDYMNTIFSAEVVGSTIREIKAHIEQEMPYHLARWGGTMEVWRKNVDVVERFPIYRNEYLRGFIQSEFNLSGTASLELSVSQNGVGTVRLNTLNLSDFPWTGTYFKDIPVRLDAVPQPGYTFTGWTGEVTTSEPSLTLNLSEHTLLTAHFTKNSGASTPIVINEINYRSADDVNPDDWVELYNTYDRPIDLGGWVFKDEDDAHTFIFPENTMVEPNGYLVVCKDSAAFASVFPDVKNYVGDFGFGLNNGGERIRLFDSQGILADSLTYDDEDPWPLEPDGTGSTLSLQDPLLDNTVPVNWVSSVPHGTPGQRNEIPTAVEEHTKVPLQFTVGQNYPNPFNSSTTIPFSLPAPERVILRIYSILGQEVMTLLDAYMEAGEHRVMLSADHLSTGLYFYRMTAGKKIRTRQMIYLK